MSADAAFALERFAWEGPDRLALSGWFSGLAPGAATAPVLVLHGGRRVRRLAFDPADPELRPTDGRRWSATFAWEEPPEAFDSAALELGADLVVALPEPSLKSRVRGDEVLDVRGATGDHTAATDSLRLQGELLAAREELEERRVALERADEELARARHDLDDERRRHAADAERYRDGLAQVQAMAEHTLAAARASIDAERSRAEETERRLAQFQARLAKPREHASLLLGLLAAIEREPDEVE